VSALPLDTEREAAMALSNSTPPLPQDPRKAMRVTDGQIRETIAKSREMLRESGEAIKSADRLLDGQIYDGQKPSSP